jgi:hypothetical protein
MIRRTARVVLLHGESSSMVDDWIDHIEIRRNANATFSVWANKYGENPVTARRRWFDWSKQKGLKTPLSILKAVENAEQYLQVQVKPRDIVTALETIDWTSAAVLASAWGLAIPALPPLEDMLNQRSLRSVGRVTVGAVWAYERHDVQMSFENWIRILHGEGLRINRPHWYEGKRYMGTWSFGGRDHVEVTDQEGGVCWVGDLQSLDLIEGPILDGVDLAALALKASMSVVSANRATSPRATGLPKGR